jgi:hypothetical protein
VYPAYVAAASSALLAVDLFVRSGPVRKLRARLFGPAPPSALAAAADEAARGEESRVRAHIAAHGGTTIFVFALVKTAACFALLGCTLATLIVRLNAHGLDDEQRLYRSDWPYFTLVVAAVGPSSILLLLR